MCELEDEDVDVASAVMVDCYPDKLPLNGPTASAVPWQRAPWFDVGPYVNWNARKRRPKPIYSGVRQRVFWPNWHWQKYMPKLIRKAVGITSPPLIVKAPLFRNAFARGTSVHRAANPVLRRSIRLFSLLHYKLDFDFVQKVDNAISEQQYFQRSIEYKVYDCALRKGPLHLASYRSRRFTGGGSLIDAGFSRFGWANGSDLEAGQWSDTDIESAWREIREFGGRHLVELVPVPVPQAGD